MGMPNWVKPVCAVAVTTLALASVLVALGHMSHSVWYDESQSHQYASQSTLGRMTTLAMQDRSYPPLFFLAVRYSLQMRDDEVGLRLPAAVFGALTLLAVYSLGTELAGSVAGAIAAFLLVLTPGAFRYFVDGNAYTLLMLVSTLSTLYLLRAARSDALVDWALFALCALVGLGTHPLFVLHLGAQVIAGIWLRTKALPPATHSYVRLLVVAGLLAGAELLWRVFYAHSGGRVLPVKWSTLFEPGTFVAMAGLYCGPQSFGGIVQLLLWGVMQAFGLYALYRMGRDRFWAVTVLIAVPLVAVPILAKLTLPYVAYRYGLGIFPLACVVAACSWKAWSERVVAQAAIASVILVYWLAGAASIARAGENTFGYQDWRGAARYLKQRFSANDAVFVVHEANLLPFRYYWKESEPVTMGTDIGVSSDQIARTASSAGTPAPRAWIVLSTFANENALVARFTESRRQRIESWVGRLAEAIQQHGLRVCRTESFQRVKVVEVRRGGCEEAP